MQKFIDNVLIPIGLILAATLFTAAVIFAIAGTMMVVVSLLR